MSTLLSQLEQPVQGKTLTLPHFIDGAFYTSPSAETFEDINPATGEVLAHVALGTAIEIDLAVAAAKKAFEEGSWPRISMAERCQILKKIGDLILAKRDHLAYAETLDTGKPMTESLEGDIPRSAQNFHFFAEFAATLSEETFNSTPNQRHFAVREPLGVVGLITPWNLPLYLATWKIAPCLVMGNTCVLKPAEWTPYTATLLAEIVQEAGLPPGVFNIVHGFGAKGAGEALTRHPDVKAISFTGETSTGKAIMAAASETLKKVSFELGGKGATIIFEDACLDEAIPTAVRAAYRNQGEICLAGSRLFVQASRFEEVMEQLVKAVQQIRVGDPLDSNTRMGALISEEHYQKVSSYLEIGHREGTCVLGGSPASAMSKGYFIEPTIFTHLPTDSRLHREEIFGPVLSVIPFETEEEVIRIVNDTPYGLSASLWSRDLDRCHRVSKAIQAGLIWVNCWFARDLRTPFGGQKMSGVGREGGRYSLDFFSEAKTISYQYHG
jgi:aminomuconate-semialdehyde/2-hydroxymuconate-6-semialdehyde dehydrogenase